MTMQQSWSIAAAKHPSVDLGKLQPMIIIQVINRERCRTVSERQPQATVEIRVVEGTELVCAADR